MNRVLVILPAYNEAATIRAVLEGIRAAAPEYDLLVVNDGSTDATAQEAAAMPGAVVLDLPFNLGIGGAMQTGFRYALRKGYDIAVQCDADGQHPASEIATLVERVAGGGAGIAIGSRYVADSDYHPTFMRRVGKSLLSRLVDALVGGGITDTTSGFRAMDRKALALFCRYYPEDYPEPEALVVAHRAGIKAIEAPVHMRPRQGGRTSIRPAHAAYYMAKVALAAFVSMFRPFGREPEDPAACTRKNN